ncbi:RsmB/NOP family class I SAM-dependent RNA methyltransferase [Paenibacillus sp. NEAU-GSW1]|uniref:RsmB/NOP family class I SAM-dependent RNA methyltransferase n=1 Tax=Paenibacillus sp. NEAU-GSW1 TaxID=2682486 RepID=UPI0012E23F54|nr:RsmB/NOP family class I SAM-dependent RNA methyltransferase [Paenibacillus sp. NEAU-GSW1]MUT66616.1 rRNA cytosine-C5-methyltransferase [Paenibacillus sp. NEAU-GSW1]
MAGFLPLAFTTKMEKLLGADEYERFIRSYDDPRLYGLRINRLKLDADRWKELSPFGDQVKPIPWAEDGFYYEEGERPGKHPHYHAGLYYIQEPSAMAPVELLDVQPGHRVLDLCAAPGGKSTQIAGKLQGSGVLVTNDNARERTKALAKNVELAGVRNAVVLNEDPAAMAPVFAHWFDRILVDAPCSGEGMFRKDESMIAEWEKHSIERCSVMQRHILRDAARMLAPGGKLVFSTCTFSPEENEAQIAQFLAEHSDFEVVQIEPRFGWKAGRPDWTSGGDLMPERLASIAGTVRLWPQHVAGEGHYAAVLQRKGERIIAVDASQEQISGTGSARKKEANAILRSSSEKKSGGKHAKDARKTTSRGPLNRVQAGDGDPILLWREFAAAHLSDDFAEEGVVQAYGSRVYLQPAGMPPLDGLRVVRAGWFVGEAGRGKFEPSQPLALGLKREEAAISIDWRADDSNTVRYLKGETLFIEAADIKARHRNGNGSGGSESSKKSDTELKGYVLLCADGFPLGWGKLSGGGMIKNELPAGWRLI